MPFMRDKTGRRLDSFEVADQSNARSLAAPAQRLIKADADVAVSAGTSANAVGLRPTDYTRRIAIVVNLGTTDLMVAEGTAGADATTPSTGYITVSVGSEYVTTSANPLFAYYVTTAGTARVVAELAA